MEKENNYYGKDCPVGMIQVEFVGCSPENKIGEYGWKPEKSTFLEIWVDGQRFRIDVGNVSDSNGEMKRGLHINGPFDFEYYRNACNACSLFIKEKEAPKELVETLDTSDNTEKVQSGKSD